MSPRALVWTVSLLALVLGACQGAPPPAPKATADPAALAAEALEAGDYGRAADLYRRALERAPESLPLHYGLAVAASYLDLRPEAIREFTWVLEHGEAGSEPVEAARHWLWRVGALPRKAPPAAAPQPETTSQAGAAPRAEQRKPGFASLEGRALSGESDQHAKPMQRLQLFLVDQPGRNERYAVRTDEEGRFRFRNVAPGSYMLSNRLAGPRLWRLRVELKPGQDTALDLTPANSAKLRDDFPGLP